jgi:predicted HicB family RNase H-like nuclease
MKRMKKEQPDALDARLTLRLPREMLRRLKHAAIERDKSLQALVLEALAELAEKEERR